MLYFRFVTKTVLITHPCFSCCSTVLAQLQGFLCFSLSHPFLQPHQWVDWSGQGVGRGQPESWPQLTTSQLFVILYDVMLHNETGGVVFLRLLRHWLGIGLLVGGNEWMIAFASLYLFCSFSFHLLNCLYLNQWVTSSCCSLVSLTHLTARVSVWAAGGC